MGVREFDITWSSNTSSGGQAAVEVTGDVLETAWFLLSSTGATGTISVQSALSSGGPWFTEASTTPSSGALIVLRITGPFAWVRPTMTTTGATVRCIGVS